MFARKKIQPPVFVLGYKINQIRKLAVTNDWRTQQIKETLNSR